MAGGSRTYWEKSCPRCGKPEQMPASIALNKVDADPKKSRKAKCVICKQLLCKPKETKQPEMAVKE